MLYPVIAFRSASPESPVFLDSDVTQAVRSNVNLHNLYDNIETVDESDVVQVAAIVKKMRIVLTEIRYHSDSSQ